MKLFLLLISMMCINSFSGCSHEDKPAAPAAKKLQSTAYEIAPVAVIVSFN